jgi:hypothetical protein
MSKVEKLKEKNHITVPILVNSKVQNILLADRHQALVGLVETGEKNRKGVKKGD